MGHSAHTICASHSALKRERERDKVNFQEKREQTCPQAPHWKGKMRLRVSTMASTAKSNSEDRPRGLLLHSEGKFLRTPFSDNGRSLTDINWGLFLHVHRLVLVLNQISLPQLLLPRPRTIIHHALYLYQSRCSRLECQPGLCP